ncbi:MAG: cell division protein FtsQ/DivIB, partial [Candidatus Eisenbacteria bacterium]|nr:cell division protein FtsQ/DivIB [Candidatus Eisenbacteria bacterium]
SGSVADLPIIRGLDITAPAAGQAINDAAARPAAALAARLAESSVNLADRVSEIWAADPDSLVLILMTHAIPVKVGRGDISERRLLALRAVLDDLACKEIEPEYIDLRFAGQVVYKPKPARVEIVEVIVEPKAVVKRPPAKKGAVTKNGVGKKGSQGRHGRHT